jgi:site-specific DNA-methyltransferase (adenine-specific)
VRDAALAAWGDGPAFVFGSLLLPPPPNTKQVAIYGKPANAGTRVCIGGIRRDVEAIYLLGRHKVTGGGRSAIFQTNAARVSGGKSGERGAGLVQKYGHPHAKPADVLQELIGLSDARTIADPFAGSGSTLVAAKAMGRRAIGVELEERYAEIAARRLSQDTLDLDFGPVP